MYLMNQNKNSGRLTAEWTPNERTALQFVMEQGRVHYSQPVYTGSQGADSTLYSVDGSYAFNERWKFTGFVSYSDQSMQVNQPNTAGYQMVMNDYNTAIGVGLEGKPRERLEVGAKVAYLYDLNTYGQSMGPTASAANVNLLNSTGGMPGITFRPTRVSFYGQYAPDKSQAGGGDVLHQTDH